MDVKKAKEWLDNVWRVWQTGDPSEEEFDIYEQILAILDAALKEPAGGEWVALHDTTTNIWSAVSEQSQRDIACQSYGDAVKLTILLNSLSSRVEELKRSIRYKIAADVGEVRRWQPIIDKHKDENTALKEALEFYADPENWLDSTIVLHDNEIVKIGTVDKYCGGKRARQQLVSSEGEVIEGHDMEGPTREFHPWGSYEITCQGCKKQRMVHNKKDRYCVECIPQPASRKVDKGGDDE